jgi:Major Facilitator Superfamily
MSSYRALFARRRAPSLALACGLGWLSFASYGLAIVLAVHAASHSFAVAGAAVASFSVGSALLAPVRGRLVDRRGPAALAQIAPIHAVGLTLLLIGCVYPLGSTVLVGSAGVAGAFAPPLIATARAAWPRVAGADLARTGHALNAALGDAAQVIGPALIGTVAALASPFVALGLLVPGPTVGAVIVAKMPLDAQRKEPASAAHRVWGVLRESSGLRTIVLGDLALGLSFGALNIAAPVIATEAGAAELAAVPLAAFAAGSVVASLASGGGRLRRSAAWRYVTGLVAVASLLPFSLLGHSLVGITAVLIAAGGGFGVLNVALFELVEQVVASECAVEAFTWLTTWSGVGLAAGAAAAGQLSRGGVTDALLLVALPVAIAAAVTLGRRSTLRLIRPDGLPVNESPGRRLAVAVQTDRCGTTSAE